LNEFRLVLSELVVFCEKFLSILDSPLGKWAFPDKKYIHPALNSAGFWPDEPTAEMLLISNCRYVRSKNMQEKFKTHISRRYVNGKRRLASGFGLQISEGTFDGG
jgi:hypothetical protein